MKIYIKCKDGFESTFKNIKDLREIMTQQMKLEQKYCGGLVPGIESIWGKIELLRFGNIRII